MTDEALLRAAEDGLKSLRQLAFTSLLVLVAWFAAWPALRGSTDDPAPAGAQPEAPPAPDPREHLAAWLALTDAVREYEDWILWEALPGEPIEEVLETVEMGGQDGSYEENVPLTFVCTWPEPLEVAFRLEPEIALPKDPAGVDARLRTYFVEVDSRLLPFEDYRVAVANERLVAVLPVVDELDVAALIGSLRLLEREVAERARPLGWDEARGALRALGFEGAPSVLDRAHPAVVEYLGDPAARAALEETPAEPAPEPTVGVPVVGVSLPVRFFPTAIAVVLAGLAFALIGPLVRLARAGTFRPTISWIAVTPTRGAGGAAVLETFLVLLSAAWVLAPLMALAQSWSGSDAGASPVLDWVRRAGFVFAAIVFAVAAVRLRRLRRV